MVSSVGIFLFYVLQHSPPGLLVGSRLTERVLKVLKLSCLFESFSTLLVIVSKFIRYNIVIAKHCFLHSLVLHLLCFVFHLFCLVLNSAIFIFARALSCVSLYCSCLL